MDIVLYQPLNPNAMKQHTYCSLNLYTMNKNLKQYSDNGGPKWAWLAVLLFVLASTSALVWFIAFACTQ